MTTRQGFSPSRFTADPRGSAVVYDDLSYPGAAPALTFTIKNIGDTECYLTNGSVDEAQYLSGEAGYPLSPGEVVEFSFPAADAAVTIWVYGPIDGDELARIVAATTFAA